MRRISLVLCCLALGAVALPASALVAPSLRKQELWGFYKEPSPQFEGTDTWAEGTSSESPTSQLHDFVSCSASWVDLAFAPAVSCSDSLHPAVTWCREAVLGVDRNSPGNATCTVSFPGTTPVVYGIQVHN